MGVTTKDKMIEKWKSERKRFQFRAKRHCLIIRFSEH